MIINFRQGIITYPSTGPVQSFLAKQGDYVALRAATSRVDIAIAHGDANYLITETTDQETAWGPLPAGVDCWLYWDINRTTGERTFGFTTVQPVAGTSAPTVEGQHWFDTTTSTMKAYISGGFREVIRVFAARVNNSTFTPLGSGVPLKPYAGTQVGDVSSNVRVGRIMIDNVGKPLRRQNGRFFTTEDQFFVEGGVVNPIRLDSAVITATAVENVPKFYVVRYSDFGQISLAGYADLQTTTIAMAMEDMLTSDTGTVCVQGLITNPDWNWTTVGAPLWVSSGGVLTETDPHVANALVFPTAKPPVARVVDQTSIFFDQGLGGMGERGPTGEGVGALSDLTDTNIVDPQAGDVLTYSGTEWTAVAPAGGNPFDQNLNTTDSVIFSDVTTMSVVNEQGALSLTAIEDLGPGQWVLVEGDVTSGNTLEDMVMSVAHDTNTNVVVFGWRGNANTESDYATHLINIDGASGFYNWNALFEHSGSYRLLTHGGVVNSANDPIVVTTGVDPAPIESAPEDVLILWSVTQAGDKTWERTIDYSSFLPVGYKKITGATIAVDPVTDDIFCAVVVNCNGEGDVLIVSRNDSTGNRTWERLIRYDSDPSEIRVFSTVLTPTALFICHATDAVTVGEAGTGFFKPAITAINTSTGSVIWSRRYDHQNPSASTTGSGLVVLDDGDLALIDLTSFGSPITTLFALDINPLTGAINGQVEIDPQMGIALDTIGGVSYAPNTSTVLQVAVKTAPGTNTSDIHIYGLNPTSLGAFFTHSWTNVISGTYLETPGPVRSGTPFPLGTSREAIAVTPTGEGLVIGGTAFGSLTNSLTESLEGVVFQIPYFPVNDVYGPFTITSSFGGTSTLIADFTATSVAPIETTVTGTYTTTTTVVPTFTSPPSINTTQVVEGGELSNSFAFNGDGSFQMPNYLFPSNDGNPGDRLVTDGAGTVTWQPATVVKHIIPIACSDETTPIVSNGSAVVFRVPIRMQVTEVRASLTSPQITGSTVTVDLLKDGVTSIFTTPLTFDNGVTSTFNASVPYALDVVESNMQDDQELHVSVTLGGNTATGLKVYLIGFETEAI